MLKNYFIIALRSMRRNLTYSLINILGLAIGLASAMVIGIWVYEEVSYEQHFEDHSRIYRVGVNFFNIGDMAPGPENFIEEIKDYPIVDEFTRLDFDGEKTFKVKEQKYLEGEVYLADENYFNLFTYAFIQGDPQKALEDLNSIVLTKEKAIQFFGTVQAIGKTLEIEDKEGSQLYTVTGVVDTGNRRSHIPAKIWLKLQPKEGNNWTSANYYNYIKLKVGVSSQQLNEQLELLVKNKIYPSLPIEQPYEEWVKTPKAYRFIPMPITDIYLKSNLRFEPVAGGNEANVKIFSIVVLVILLIAGVNYVNITTARASKRAKEVGIRKSLGTDKKSLIFQFLSESVLISIIAFLLSLLFADIFNSLFQRYTGMPLIESLLADFRQLGVLFLITVTIGLVAGVYPAFYISSFKPISALKGRMGNMERSLFRNILVIVQFTISIILISSTIIIYRQLHYIQTKDLGLNKENVIIISNAGILESRQEAFVESLKDYAAIEVVSRSSRIPTGRGVYVKTFRTTEMQDGLPIQLFYGDDNYLAAMGFRLLKGRNFSENIASDTAAVLLNESAVRALGLADPIGASLNDNLEVIGVISDFNFESPRKKIEPAAIMMLTNGSRLAIKIAEGNSQEAFNFIQGQWQQFQASEQMEHYFLDQSYAKLMEKEQIMSKAITLFSVLAILISSLGLYGLSAFICDQRTREIGIRKVFGAQISQVVLYLNNHLTKPILIAILIAIPLSFLMMEAWLNEFVFRTRIEIWVFIVSCCIALMIAWITVSWQSFRTALKNPVESLKSE